MVTYNRAIVKETPLYLLLAPDATITIGFCELIPKVKINKRVWVNKIWQHLESFCDQLNITGLPYGRDAQITYQPSHRFPFSYLNGSVAVIPTDGRVEISQSHPKMEQVIDAFLSLAFISKSVTYLG